MDHIEKVLLEKASKAAFELPEGLSEILLNPTLEIMEVGEGVVAAFRPSEDEDVELRSLTPQELLALKVVADGLDPVEVAEIHSIPVGRIDRALWSAWENGLLMFPASRIVREQVSYPEDAYVEGLLMPRVFSLQWHITQRCDLHCKHCYDRTDRVPLDLERAKKVLDQLRSFCWDHFVRGHVVFSGGNPFLHPDFFGIYNYAVDLGFSCSILGNPIPERWLEKVLAIESPQYYQVSLEGLEEKNDDIRGKGHFHRTLNFLRLLEEAGVESSVMLTLTSRNIGDVLPLARILDDYTNSFTFNRLSTVGEGAQLSLPSKEEFWAFLREFVDAAQGIDCIYFKENLINCLRLEQGLNPIDGCTGFGCGAAFNFLALLSDGEVHACRKFPSLLGNIFKNGIDEIYHSNLAIKYRQRPMECRSCRLSPSCGGCLASTNSLGMEIFSHKDPYCPL